MEGEKAKNLNIKGVDDLIRLLGHPGRFQIMVFVLVALNYFPVVFHHVCMAFYGYTPPFECRPERGFPSGHVPKKPASEPASYAVRNANATEVGNSHVIMRACDVVMATDGGVNRSQQCEAGEFRYLLPKGEKTIVMEWDLVCGEAYLNHLTTTVYYCGVMLGGFICGYLSDYFGRRPVVLTTLTGVTLLGTALAFVQHLPAFLALRFALGFLMQGLHTASYIMAVELFPVEERTLAGCVIQVFWGGAVLALGLVSWVLKDWRHIQLAISMPSVLAVSYFWLMPESLRWLLAKERFKEAEVLVQRIAAFNRLDSPLRRQPEMATLALRRQQVQMSDSNHNSTASSLHLSGELRREKRKEEKKEREEEKRRRKRIRPGSVKDLFSTLVMLKRSLVLFFIWFAANVAYFGLVFMSTTLAGNRFLNYTISASVEIFAYIINIFVSRRFGRRNPLCVYLCVAAVSSMGVGLITTITGRGMDFKAVIIAFSVLGKFAAGGSFTFMELLTVEMYPTVLRNVGAGFCATWGRLGAVLAPQFLSLSLYTFDQLPALVIGVTAFLGALLTLLLPDTSHVRLPDTVLEITLDSQVEDGDLMKPGEKTRGGPDRDVILADPSGMDSLLLGGSEEEATSV